MCCEDVRRENSHDYKKIIFELVKDGDALIYRALTDKTWNETSRLEFLGTAYLLGRHGIKPDAEKAVYLLHVAAAAGSAEASYYLAECLNFGIGTKQDRLMARLYYRIAMRNARYHDDAKQRLHEMNQIE